MAYKIKKVNQLVHLFYFDFQRFISKYLFWGCQFDKKNLF